VLLPLAGLVVGRSSRAWRVALAASSIVAVFALAFVFAAPSSARADRIAPVLVLAPPTIAALLFSALPPVRERRGVMLVGVAVLWLAGLLAGLTLAVNLGLVSE
jgi:hypothetical protein